MSTVPPPTAPPRLRYWTTRRVFIAGAILFAVLITGMCLGGAAASSGQTASSRPSPASSAGATAAATPKPTPTPTPAPTPLALSGQGSKVLPLDLARGQYRLSWTAKGNDNFILHLEGGGATMPLVNQIPPDPSSGETFLRVDGGHYVLTVAAATLTWTITLTPL